jgi:hypothetical protein
VKRGYSGAEGRTPIKRSSGFPSVAYRFENLLVTDWSRRDDRETALFLPGAVFQDGFLPAIEGEVVVSSFSSGVVAKFFLITLLKQVEIEGDLLGELENVLEVFIAVAL